MTGSRQGWLVLLLVTTTLRPVDCGPGEVGGGQPRPPRLPCKAYGDNNWASYTYSYRVSDPLCPVDIFAAGELKHFTFSATAYNTYVIRDGGSNNLDGQIVNDFGIVKVTGTAPWIAGQYGIAQTGLDGDYNAGTGSRTPRDSAILATLFSPLNWETVGRAWAAMPVNFVKNAAISGPTGAEPGDNVTVVLSVDASDFSNSPTVYWTLNGAALGENGTSASSVLQDPGDYTFLGMAYDSTADVAWSALTVHVEYPDCPNCMAPRFERSPYRRDSLPSTPRALEKALKH